MKVSSIAYGNWVTHGSQVQAEQATACVGAALDAGITTFDTADVYAQGAAESILGRALAGVRRESIELCTKVYFPVGQGQNDRGLSRKHIMEACHASLRRLGTDYIDLYQTHRFDYETPLEETLRALDDLVRQGKVLYVGVSEWRADEIASAVEVARSMDLDKIVSNQPQYSLLWRVIEEEVLPLCNEEGIGQIVWSPLAQGVLTGKYRPGEPPPAGSRALDPTGSQFMQMITDLMSDETLERIAAFARLASEAGLSPAHLALAWVLGNPGVSAAIVGASRPEQVTENAGAIDVQLDAEVVRAVEELLDPLVVRDPSLTRSPRIRP